MTQLSFDLGAALKRDGQRAAIEAAYGVTELIEETRRAVEGAR